MKKKGSAIRQVCTIFLITFGMLLICVSLTVKLMGILEEWYYLLGIGAVCFAAGTIVGCAGKKKKPSRLEPAVLTEEAKKKLDGVIAYIKEKSAVPSYHIQETDAAPGLTDSKFGGYPYWPEGMAYPKAASGEKLFLLAQINFAQLQPEDDLLPTAGILQFFIENDNLYGEDFDNMTAQKNFRVVYHPEIGAPLSIEQLRELGVRANTDLSKQENMLPSQCEEAICFQKTVDSLSGTSDDFEVCVREAMAVLYGQTLDGHLYSALNRAEYNYLTKPFCPYGHKLLGTPDFVQQDPRSVPIHYDTLLFQMDSRNHTMWGDSGAAYFFINREALRRKDFSDILYHWDCL